MSKTVFAALITALLASALVWMSHYLQLPFWYCLLSSALFFAAPQANLLGLVTTLFTALLGILFGVIYMQIMPHLGHFAYKMEIIIAVMVFLLYLITQTQYLKYFACSLITLSLLVMQNGDWVLIYQAVVLGIVFGFIARVISIMMTGKSLQQ
ncbi:uncharacterized protein DUF1097 [Orbus hercynius]|uniref:Uncharacterized protein DUF1097 n=1 Tax=Orbus hercynius TaxID=593135 RepID=A0A495REM6_9GAMM|nr:DUF1097 family protein [Orbus hercynius]RKS85943.1 uncharacterized protein DUF1097 [Orbus hercynius]